MHPQRVSYVTENIGWNQGGPEGSEGQVLSKLCFLLPEMRISLKHKLTHHGIITMHMFTELKGRKVVFCFQLKWKYKM